MEKEKIHLRVNGKMLMRTQGLFPFDRIRLVKTEFVFMPFCSENFNWRDGFIGSTEQDKSSQTSTIQVQVQEKPQEK